MLTPIRILKSARDSLELVGLERFPNVGDETSNVELQATTRGEQSEYGTTRRGLKSRHIQLRVNITACRSMGQSLTPILASRSWLCYVKGEGKRTGNGFSDSRQTLGSRKDH